MSKLLQHEKDFSKEQLWTAIGSFLASLCSKAFGSEVTKIPLGGVVHIIGPTIPEMVWAKSKARKCRD